jgi:hypothetical protein
MKYSIIAAVTALVVGASVTAHAENPQSLRNAVQPVGVAGPSQLAASSPQAGVGSNAASLNTLLAEWDRAAFNPPSKPAQYRVYGRDGYVTSGPEYNAMVELIRSAVRDTQLGRDHDAAAHIAEARSMLASIAQATPTHANG